MEAFYSPLPLLSADVGCTMAGMTRSPIIDRLRRLAPALLLALTLPAAASARGVEVRYLANEGFLIAAGEAKVLIDALYGEGIRGYPAVPTDIRRRAEAAEGEFAGVDLVLASHFHGDHFDARSVARHLAANPKARFVSTQQAAEQVRGKVAASADRVSGLWPAEGERVAIEHAGIRVTALRLHHGRLSAQNVGLIVEIAGVKLIHLGDTGVTVEEIRPLGLRREKIDVALVPYWHIGGPVVDELGARHVVAIHLPSPDAPRDYFEGTGNLEGQIETIRAEAPAVWVPLEPLESRSFEPGGSR